MTLTDVVLEAARRLQASGFDDETSRREAATLARMALGWDQATWIAHGRESAPPEFVDRFADWIARRVAREPVAYIAGTREFYGRDFRVTPDVLIPRPETEGIVEAALPRLRALADAGRTPVAIDVGTGSGCLAITLALECPRAQVVATDVSIAALTVARENARRHHVEARIEWRHTSLTGEIASAADLVVSNPPYVAARDRDTLPRDVAAYEPALALFGGDDGLEVIRDLVPAARRALVPGGTLIVEMGVGQAPMVAQVIAEAGLTLERVARDLAGIDRIAIATLPREPV